MPGVKTKPGMNSLIAGPFSFREQDSRRQFESMDPTSNQSSKEDIQPFPTPENASIALENKNGARLHYTYYPASPSTPNRPNPFAKSLVVFINGLILPRAAWEPSIHNFHEKRINAQLPYPALLCYDRFGQGDSDRDPNDMEPPPCHGHDIKSAVHDLKQFTIQIWKEHLSLASPSSFPALILVGNSIGCAIARLFAETYPGTVLGLLLLDSIMANSDIVSIWPDPDAKGFDESQLPPGVDVEDVRVTREKWTELFHPSVPNMEGLTRRNLAKLLPYADGPVLEGFNGDGPFLTVCGHDWETFAEQTYTGSLHTPKLLTMTYANPAWQKYNESLIKITTEGRAIGPIIAVGCGHFIQKDGPGFVSDELVSLLDRVVNRVEQVSERDRGAVS